MEFQQKETKLNCRMTPNNTAVNSSHHASQELNLAFTIKGFFFFVSV